MTALQNTQVYSSDIFKCARELVQFYSDEAQKNMVINKIARVEDSNEREEIYVSTEEYTVPDIVAEGGTVPFNNYGPGYRTQVLPVKLANRIAITVEMMMKKKDQTEPIAKIIDAQARSLVAQHYAVVTQKVADFYNFGFTNTYAVAPDLEPLFSANHTFANGQVFSNLLPAVAPSLAVLEDVEAKAGAFVGPNGLPMPFTVNTIYVKKGGSASVEFRKILWYNNGQYRPTVIGNVNIRQGANYKIIELPFITSSTAYFFASDFEEIGENTQHPIICHFTQRPDVLEDFTRDQATLSMQTAVMTIFKTAIVNLPVGLYGSQGA